MNLNGTTDSTLSAATLAIHNEILQSDCLSQTIDLSRIFNVTNDAQLLQVLPNAAAVGCYVDADGQKTQSQITMFHFKPIFNSQYCPGETEMTCFIVY